MFQAQYVKNGSDELKIESLEQKELNENEVRVKVHAVSLNYRDLLNLQFGTDKDFIAASDGAGEVIEVGNSVSDLKVGDKVVGLFFPDWQTESITNEKQESARGGNGFDGMLAQEVVGKSNSFVKFPEHLSYEEASTLPCAGLTAWNALFEYGNLKSDETIVIQGTGGVALYALQLAKNAGARAIVLSSKTEKIDYLKSLGADHIINYRETPDWHQKVLELTNNIGADLILEVGGAGTLERSMQSVKVNGQISFIGVLAGLEGKVDPLPIIMKSLIVKGVYVGSREMQERFHATVSESRLKPILDTNTFSFENANKAYEYQRSAKHSGNVVVKII